MNKTFIKNKPALISLLFLLTGLINAQTLTVSRGDNDHPDSYENANGSDIVMLQFKLSADADMEVTGITVDPNTMTIHRDELVDTEIRIYEDINDNGVLDYGTDEFITSANYGSAANQVPSEVTVNIPNKIISAGTSQNWIIVHTFQNGDDGDNISINIPNMSVSSGSVSGTPVNGYLRTVETLPFTVNGSLFLGAAGNNPAAHNISASASNEVMLQLILATSTINNGTITQIDFDMSGTGDESTDLTSAKLYKDGDANGQLNLEEDTQIGSTVSSFGNDSILSFSGLSETITAGSYEHWIVVYNFNGSAGGGETFKLDLTANSDVTASGMTISGAPVNGNTATISTTGSLTLSAGSNNPSSRTVSASESQLAMMQIKLTANATEDIDITSIGFKTSGTANESTDVDSVILVKDVNGNGNYDVLYDSIIDTSMTLTDNGKINFSGINQTINAGTSENWLLLYYLNGSGSSGETFKTYVDSASLVAATGVTSSQSISATGLPVTGNIMTISSVGTLTLALAATNPGDENYNATASNMTMLAFTMTANNVEDIDLTSIKVNAETNNVRKSQLEDDDIKIYEDTDKNGILNTGIDRFITSATYNGAIYPTNATISISGETIAAGSTVQWIIVHTITNGPPAGSAGDYIQVSVLKTDISGTGAVSSSSVNLSGSNLFGGTKTYVSGVPGTLTLSEGPQNPAYRFISRGTQNETMLQFQLSADAVENINISQFNIVTSGTGNESNDLDSVRVFVDGDDDGSLNLLYDTQLGTTITSLTDNDTLIFTGFNDTVTKGSAKNYIIVYNFNTTNNTVGETFKAIIGNTGVTATGLTSTSSITPTGGPAYGEQVTITDTGTLTVSAGANNPAATNVTNADNNVVTIQLNIAAGSNEDITITSISFTLSGTFNDTTDFEGSSFRLYNDDNGNGVVDFGESQLGSGQDPGADNGTVTFSGLNETILKSTNVNWIVLVNLNGSASNFENFRVSFTSSTHITATGDNTGNPVYPDGVPVQGGLFTVGATGSLSLTKGTNNPAAGSESAAADSVEMLQLKLTASAVESISVTSITFTASGTGDDKVDLDDKGNGVSLYLDVNNDGLLDAGDTQFDTKTTYSANDGTVTFTVSDTIPAGSYHNWLVVYDLDGSASSGETFRTGIYNASQISSVGITSGNPITETGFPVVGNYKTIGSVGSMTLLSGDYNPGTSDITITTDFATLQFKLSASSIEDIDVDNVTITHEGTGDPVNDIITNGVQLVQDVNNNGVYDSGTDNILASTSYSGTTATFALTSVKVALNTTENWLIMYTFTNSLIAGETFRTRLVNLTDVSLTGDVSTQSITPGGSVPFSGGTMTVSGDFSLPVELSSFNATGDHGFISLKWVTESEINNLGFSVERKTESENDFKEIATYNTYKNLTGAGTTPSRTEYTFNDSTVIPGKKYIYRLLQHDYNGNINVQSILTHAVAEEPLPAKFELLPNYPNPFNPETTIKFALPELSKVKITIFNILGQEIKTLLNKPMEAGTYKYNWDGKNGWGEQASSGIYFCVMHIQTPKGNEIIKNHKMIKLK